MRTRADGSKSWLSRGLILAAVGLVALSVLGGAPPASAHANLLFTSPAANSTVAVVPETLAMFFDEPITIGAAPVFLEGPDGVVETGAPSLAGDGTSLEIPVPAGQAQGIYEVRWQVTADDGEVMAGSFPFAVGPTPVGLAGGTSADTKGATETAVLRGLLLAALALSLGERAGRWVLRRISNQAGRRRSWLPGTAVVGLAAAAGLAFLVVGNGSLATSFTDPTFAALASRPGILALIEVAAFTWVAITARWRPRWSWMPLGVVVVAEAVRAHPAAANPIIGIPLTVVHLGGAMLWTGMLIYVLRTVVAWRREPDLARSAFLAYSRPAVWLFATIVATGLGNALLLVPVNEILSSAYGQVLLVKLGVVALAAGLAWTARGRLRAERPASSIISPARVEAIALIGVLALSATLTVLPPPADANAALPFAPPAAGPVVPAAAMTGYVQIKVEAGTGQLVVQLEAPEIYDDSGQVVAVTPTLAGAIATPSGKVTQLAFRSCGSGCFFTAMTWQDGSSHLTLSPTVGTLPTASTGLTVDWPPLPADDLLDQAIAAMNAVPSLILYERVTADPASGLGELSSFPMSGAEYIQRALFASGKVPAVVRLPDIDGNRRIVISFPAESAVDELTIGPDGRIVSETLIASNLVTKTFIYPE